MTSEKPSQLRAIPPLSIPQPVIDLRTEGEQPKSLRGVHQGPRCEKCSGPLRVRHTGSWKDGQRQRRYQCEDCAHVKFLIEYDPEVPLASKVR